MSIIYSTPLPSTPTPTSPSPPSPSQPSQPTHPHHARAYVPPLGLNTLGSPPPLPGQQQLLSPSSPSHLTIYPPSPSKLVEGGGQGGESSPSYTNHDHNENADGDAGEGGDRGEGGEKGKGVVKEEKEKPADYVYFQRRPDELSDEARTRAAGAKVKMESYYKLALDTAIDLNVRSVSSLSGSRECPSLVHPVHLFICQYIDMSMRITAASNSNAKSPRPPLNPSAPPSRAKNADK